MKKTKTEKGITLVALIITVIILLMLAVVAINAIKGDGIIAYAENAASTYKGAQATENDILQNYIDNFKIQTGEIIKGERVYLASTDGYTADYYINQKGEKETNSSFAITPLIEVESGSTYYFSNPAFYDSYYNVALYDNDGKFIKAYGSSSINTLDNSYCYVTDSFRTNNYERECNWITIPDGVAYIAFNVIKSQISWFKVYKNAWSTAIHTYTSVLPSDNNLTGKSAYFYGDSIADGVTAGNESFPEHIAGAHNMKYRNAAVAGNKLSNYYNGLTTSAATKTILSELTENDYFIVEGFVNDAVGTYTPLPLGTLSEKGTTEFDTTTFIGLLEKFIYDYKQAGYKGKLGFVLTSKPTKYGESTNANIRNYWDAAISVFEKYDLQYLDLWNKTYSYSDGLHPDYEGTFEMTKDVEVWMNSF